MGDILAIVGKSIFEAERGPSGERLRLGDVFPTARYASKNKALEPLAAGGDLYLVTVRPDDVLWLVGVLRRPTFDGEGWSASPNTEVVRDVTAAIPQLVFVNGKGLQPKPGALGMSLQTPRPLTAGDASLLGGAPVAAPTPVPAAAPTPTPAPVPVPVPVAVSAPPEPPVGDDPEEVLGRLLARWAVTPWAELIPLARRWSELGESTAARALRQGDGHVDDTAWHAVLAAGRPADVQALADTFHRGSLDALLGRVGPLVALAPDPRLTGLLHRLLLAPPFRATSSQPVWNRLFEVASSHPDPATLHLVRKLAEVEFPSGGAMQKYMAAKFAAFEKRLVAAGVEGLAPPADVAAVLAALGGGEQESASAAERQALPTRPAELPTGASLGSVAAFGGTTAREVRRSPSGRWCAAWVDDPCERDSSVSTTTAALVGLDPKARKVLRQWPMEADDQAFALGSEPGRLAIARGRSVVVVDGNRSRSVEVLPVDRYPSVLGGQGGEEAEPVLTAVAFGDGDDELHALAQVPVPPGPDGWVRSEHVWFVCALATGAVVERFRVASPGRGNRRGREQESMWASASALVLLDSEAAYVFDRRWGAFSQAFVVSRQHLACDGRTLATAREGEGGGLSIVDVASGLRVGGGVDERPIDVWGDRVATRRPGKNRWSSATGPVTVRDRSGAVAWSLPLAADSVAPVALVGEDEALVGEGDRLRVVGPEGQRAELSWSVGRVGALAAAGGTRVVVAGSVIGLDVAGRARTVHERDVARCAALSADGQTLYLGVTKSVRAVPVGKGKAKSFSQHTYDVVALAAAPDGTVVSAGKDQLVVVWEASGSVRHRLAEHRAPLLGLGLDPRGELVASTGEDGRVRLSELGSGREVAAILAPGCTGPVAFAADGVHVAWLDARGVRIGRDGQRVAGVDLAGPTALASHPERPLFVVATGDGDLVAVLPDGTSRSLAQRFWPPPRALVFLPDGRLWCGSVPDGVDGATTELALDFGGR